MRLAAAIAIAVAAGVVQALSIAAPWNGQPQWWLQLASLATLVWVLRRLARVRDAALVGWAFAIAWLCATFWWLFISMHVYGGLAWPLAALGVLLLAAFLGTYYAGAAALHAYAWRGRHLAALPLFAGAWLAAELMRASWFTGFPWGAGGYAHVDGPLAVLAPWIGVYGIGAVASALAYLLVLLVDRARSKLTRTVPVAGAAVALLAVLNLLGPPTVGAPTGALSVELLQGNIPQDEKFERGSGIPLALRWYLQQLSDARATLVVAPETAIPLLPQLLPEGYLNAIAKRYASGAQAALIGLPLSSPEDGYTNSVLAFRPNAPIARYDKYHLVPFGEFVPPLFKWFTRMMNIPLSDFGEGGLRQNPVEWMGQRLGLNICYEDLFGEDLAARFLDPARAPTMFVNVSNIAWFGNTIAIDQHLHASRMRTLEFQRPMLRATNTGATAIIDHTGRVTHQLARHTRGVLAGEVEGRDGITPFAAWSARLALWPLWLAAIAAVAAVWPWRRHVLGPAQ